MRLHNHEQAHTEEVIIYDALNKTSNYVAKYALAMFIIFFITILSAEALTPTPSIYYKFEDNCNDEEGLSNCLVVGDCVYTPSIHGKSIYCNSSNAEYVNTSWGAGDWELKDNITICMLVKQDDAKWTVNANGAITGFLKADGELYIKDIRDSITPMAATKDGAGQGHYAIQDGYHLTQYIHLCYVKRDDNHTIYIDGYTNSTMGGTAFVTNTNAGDIQIFEANEHSGWEGYIDDYMIWNDYSLNATEILNIYNELILSITIAEPTDNEVIGVSSLANTNGVVWFNFTVSQQSNCSLNDTRWSNFTSLARYNNSYLQDGSYSLTLFCNATLTNNTANASVDFRIDNTNPIITPTYRLQNNLTIVYNSTLSANLNLSDEFEIYSYNITLANGTQIYGKSNVGQRNYTVNISYNVDGTPSNYFNAKICDLGNSDNLNCITNRYYFNNLNPSTKQIPSASVGEELIFKLNITQANWMFLSAKLLYNNTYYNAGDISNFTINITAISLTTEQINKTVAYQWMINVSEVWYNLSSYEQAVSNFYLDNCTTNSMRSLNFTLRDESNNSLINGNVIGTFNYGTQAISKTYTLNMQGISNFGICISPNWTTFNGNYSIFYSGTDYPQRRYYDNMATFDNSTQNINLYLLSSSSGIYVRFMVTDVYSNPLSGVQIDMTKVSDGLTVEQENTDDSGIATFFPNPDIDYTFTFIKSGYQIKTYTLRPTTSEIINVQLVTNATTAPPIYSSGISYSFSPKDTALQNGTTYQFTFSLTSETWDLESCTFYLLNNNSAILSSVAGTFSDSSCTASINYNTGTLTNIYSRAVYGIEGNLFNVSYPYSVMYTYTGQFSLKNFIDDLSNFAGAGFNDFTRMIIAFIVIFAITAYLAKQMGFVEPNVLIPLVIVLVWFFSYVGWFRIEYTNVIINAATTAKLEKYFIAILISLTGGAYLIKRITD